MVKRTKNNKKKGFTLIELIIVLAILAIIALLAIPNFMRVRAESKVKADKSNCQQIKRIVMTEITNEKIIGNGTFVIAGRNNSTPGKISGSLPATMQLASGQAADGSDIFKDINKPSTDDTDTYTVVVSAATSTAGASTAAGEVQVHLTKNTSIATDN